MWMMGYNDGGGELNFQDHSSFNGRKLRPLIPRPLSSFSTSSSPPPPNPHDFFSHFHHMATVTDQSKREFHTPPVVVSSRWNPTPEQLRVLEELYRRGTRTPSAEQIQHITAQLRRYGKIEGKNVFYWFQNHKARERQKRRRQMESSISVDNSSRDVEIIERKDSESGRKAYQVVEQTKNWAPSTNCSTLAEESVPIQRVEKGSVMTECRTTDGWIQFDDEMGELHQRRNNNFGEKNAAASSLHHHQQQQQHMMMQLPDCPGCCCSTTTTATTITTIMQHPFPKPHHNNNINNNNLTNSFIRSYRETILEEGEEEEGESETLQLFPLCSDIIRSNNEMGGKEESEISGNSVTMNTNMTPLQFFEFLPLKN